MTARELGNTGLVNVQANKNLEPFLNQATIMVVSVTASTTQGVEISKEDLDVVSEACDIGKLFTHLAKQNILIQPIYYKHTAKCF